MDNVRSRPNMTNAQGVSARPVKKIHSDESHEDDGRGDQDAEHPDDSDQKDAPKGEFTIDALRAISGGEHFVDAGLQHELYASEGLRKSRRVKVVSANPSVAFKKKQS